MAYLKMSALAMVVAVAVAVAATSVVEGQSMPACASKLVPCADYINSTNPSPSCCNPLKEAVTNELSCLCNLYNTPNLLASFGININQALNLTRHCQISGDISACNAASRTGSTVPPPPPAVTGNNGNGLGKISWAGMCSLLLLWASMMLY